MSLALIAAVLTACSWNTGPFVHEYPAPGPGCGDTSEMESGDRWENWTNDDYAGVRCHPDHVEIDAGADVRDPRWTVERHRIGSSLFRLRASHGRPPDSDDDGFDVSIVVYGLDGGPDTRAGIAFLPYPRPRDHIDGVENPVYFFNIDRNGRWHVADHEAYGGIDFRRELRSGPASSAVEYRLRLVVNVAAKSMTFSINDQVVSTLELPPFRGFELGHGIACSYNPQNNQTCRASVKDYRIQIPPPPGQAESRQTTGVANA